jgi:hypothetical protein
MGRPYCVPAKAGTQDWTPAFAEVQLLHETDISARDGGGFARRRSFAEEVADAQ